MRAVLVQYSLVQYHVPTQKVGTKTRATLVQLACRATGLCSIPLSSFGPSCCARCVARPMITRVVALSRSQWSIVHAGGLLTCRCLPVAALFCSVCVAWLFQPLFPFVEPLPSDSTCRTKALLSSLRFHRIAAAHSIDARALPLAPLPVCPSPQPLPSHCIAID